MVVKTTNKRRKKLNGLLLVIQVLIFIIISFSINAGQKPPAVTVVLVKNHHPLSFELPNGKPAGLYVDIWEQWSKTTGIPVEFNLTTLQLGLDLVKKKNVIHAGLFRNNKRGEWASFSIPFSQVGSSLYYNKLDKNSDITKTLKDFEGKKIAVLPGSYHEQHIIDNYPLIRITTYNIRDSFLMLLNGDIQAIFDETPAMKSAVSRLGMSGVFESANISISSNLVHAVVAKGQPLLLETINSGFENIPLEILNAIDKKWLPNEMPFFKGKAPLKTLTLAEQNWLYRHQELVVPLEVDAYPYVFKNNNGYYSGAWVDYMEIISQRLNINIKVDGFDTWDQALSTLKDKKADFKVGVTKTKEREEHLDFTKPFINFNFVIVMKKGHLFIDSMSGLRRKKLGIIKGYAEAEFIKRDYPEINIVAVSNVMEGIKLVANGEIDGYFDSLSTINRKIDEHNFSELIIALMTPYQSKLTIAVSNKHELLVPILNKVLDSIDDKARASIANNWLAIRTDKGIDVKNILYWAIPILLLFITIILVVLKVNRTLKREIERRTKIENERALLEKQLLHSQKMEAVGSLAGGIAHDFNNIIGIILGNTELIKINLSNAEKVKSYSDNIYAASERAASLVSQIMTFSRMKISSFHPMNLSTLVEDNVQLIKSTSPSNITFKLDISDNENFIISGDDTQITQVLINLCTNATHAMEEFGGTLTVSLCYSSIVKVNLPDNGENFYLLTIADTGCGIDKQTQDKMFDPFFSTKGIGKGTGLGLSVVHNIIKQHHGEIVVESTLGKGTRFLIFLPKSFEEAKKEANSTGTIEQGNGNILIVEDEVGLRALYKEQLEAIGYVTTTCSDGKEALAEFEKAPLYYDLVLTDHCMPVMTGRAMATEMLAIRPSLPIILATGYADLMSINETSALGLFKCLVKPIKKEVLYDTIHRCLGN